MNKKGIRFTADFETSTPEWYERDGFARVWAFAVCEIGNTDNFVYGNSIDDFMKLCSKKKNSTFIFHNLKFDGSYIIDWLFRNGFTHIKDSKDKKDKTFTTLINDMGQFYNIIVYFHIKGKNVNKVTFEDSLKLLNFSVDKIAKDFDLDIRKLELDYNTYREIGHELTPHEVEYIKNDVTIMAKALKVMYDEGLDRLTIGSCALNNFKEGTKDFKTLFPELPTDLHNAIKNSYKGGFTYLSPIHKNETIRNITVLDVNSLYPSVQRNERLPYGMPIQYKGKYKKDILYPLYIQVISCSFDIREGKIPTIQLKNNLSFIPTEYLTSSEGKIVTLTLTSVDLELFLKHYRVHDLVYHYGFKFKSLKGIFSNYIDFWTKQKIEAKKLHNSSKYLISKLMMNSLCGKFGTSNYVRSKYPYYEDEIVKYEMGSLEERAPVYLPIASFITSYARKKTIETSEKIREYTKEKYGLDHYIYSDTDSIHMISIPEEELKKFVDIDDYELGKWKIESNSITRGRFIRQKCYIEEEEITEEDYKEKLERIKKKEYNGNIYQIENKYYELNTTIAGLPKQLGKYINFDNFKEGLTIKASDLEKEHKLGYKKVKGGVLLVDTDFTIK